MTFADFIASKGARRLADTLDAPIGTVYAWRSDNCIPRRRWPDLMTKLPEVGLADLLAMEASRSRQSA